MYPARWLVTLLLMVCLGTQGQNIIPIQGGFPLNFSSVKEVSGITDVTRNLNFSVVNFGTLLFGPDLDRPFGYCDDQGQNCDWDGYWWSVWTTGMWAWIIASSMLGTLVLYVLLKICCCCCLCIGGVLFSILGCCCKCFCSTLNNAMIWTVRIIILCNMILGSVGFALAVVGWAEVETVITHTTGNYSKYLTEDLKAQTDSIVKALTTVKDDLLSTAQETNQTELLRILTDDQAMSAATIQEAMVANWTFFEENYVIPTRRSWFYLFWIAIAVPFGILTFILFLGAVLQCGAGLPVPLTVCGLFACTLIWAAIAVTGAGISAVDDACVEAAAVPRNFSRGYGLLSVLQCSRPHNEFESVASVYGAATVAAYQGACNSVRGLCTTKAMSCPPLAAECRKYSDVDMLDTRISVTAPPAAGGCNSTCSVHTCSVTCSGSILANASKGLLHSMEAVRILNESVTSVLLPLLTCQHITSGFLPVFSAQCAIVQKASGQIIWGMFLLAIASLVGCLVTLFLSSWFDNTSGGGSRKSKDDGTL